jgi:DNA-binding NtrC family response regulator
MNPRTIHQGADKDVVLAIADNGLRQRLRESLIALRWRVHEAGGGAEAFTLLGERNAEALLMDSWLPDLEVTEFAEQIAALYPKLDVLSVDGGALTQVRSTRRNELLHALRELQESPRTDTAAWLAAPVSVPARRPEARSSAAAVLKPMEELICKIENPLSSQAKRRDSVAIRPTSIPGLVGESEPMLELARLIRLVAPRNSTVLIEGETGTGKELVATAVHRLSARSARPMTVINCAAIPEALLEAELFGHTRGAFTGAEKARTGRIEAAHGGTLFLDEIAELPLAVQAKLLRFLECGELQRVGDNEVVRVDVRVIAATHQDLEQRVVDGSFRLDLYHRLAVFPLEVPALRERMDDLELLSEHLLSRLGADAPRKYLTPSALDVLRGHNWPGNVRELGHVLERAAILSGDCPEVAAEDVRYRRKPRP